MNEKIRLKEAVGKGYDEFWTFKGRYRVVKGGRASKKSRTAALWFISNMMKHPDANLLVIRKTYNALENSCFSELKWAIDRLQVGELWTMKTSPLEMSFVNGGKIYFKGLSDSMKVTGITADKGKICWLWIDEAYEINDENDFNMLDESIRGKINPGLFKQTTLTFNPWSGNHWLKKRFFDNTDDGVLAITTDYTCNEWLDSADLHFFEKMCRDNPRRFKVAGKGDWGVCDGLVYENWEESEFDYKKIAGKKGVRSAFGLDFGYTADPTALCCMLVDDSDKIIYIFDEMYEYGLSNRKIYDVIRSKGYKKEVIFADSAEPKSIDELYSLGLRGIRKARKGKDSVSHGIQFVQGYKLVVSPKCVNFLKEIMAYSWGNSIVDGRVAPKRGDNHLMDAMRYGLTEVSSGGRFGF